MLPLCYAVYLKASSFVNYEENFSLIVAPKLKTRLIFLCFRSEEESEFREFLETVAVVLCSDIDITPDIFHRAARGYGVST